MKGLSKTVTTKTPVPDTTAVVKADARKSDVIRTGIPASVRNTLNLKAGDRLVWEIAHDGVRVFVKVTKAEEGKKEE